MKKNDLTYLLFEGKNKDYGSYLLRTLHSRYLIFGFFLAIFLIGGAFVYPWLRIKSEMKNETDDALLVDYQKIISYSELSAPPPIEAITPPKQIEKVKVKTVKYVKPVVKKDDEIQEEELIPTMDELATANTGFENIEGIDSVVFEPTLPPPPPSPQPVEPFIIVEIMPEYPGGQAALIEYISANVRYPQLAKEVEAQGTVYIEFVVGTDGYVSNVQVLRGIGFGCDEEAVRVVKSVQRWKPGVQQNHKVPVKMVVPIKFKFVK